MRLFGVGWGPASFLCDCLISAGILVGGTPVVHRDADYGSILCWRLNSGHDPASGNRFKGPAIAVALSRNAICVNS